MKSNKYGSIHYWVNTRCKKTGICQECNKKGKTEWASNTHDYKRDIKEYTEKCRSCHLKYDYKMGFRKGLKGKPAWNKGISPSTETRIKMGNSRRGKKHSEETKKKISNANKNQIPWYKGKTGVY